MAFIATVIVVLLSTTQALVSRSRSCHYYHGDTEVRLYVGEFFSFDCETRIADATWQVISLANASQLYIEFKGERYNLASNDDRLTRTSGTQVTFTIPQVDISDYGRYTCSGLCTPGSSNSLDHVYFLHVDYMPTAPILDYCIFYNWTSLDCVWRTRKMVKTKHPCYLTLKNTNSSITYAPLLMSNTVNNTSITTVNNSLPLTGLNILDHYTIEYVIFSNIRENDSFTSLPQNIGSLKTIVQPAAPILSITNLSSSQINLTITQSRDEHFTYDVTYSSPWITLQHISSNHSSMTLSHLNPYSDYNITVKSKTPESSYWSDPGSIMLQTLPAAVESSVEFSGGNYYLADISTDACDYRKCNVTIFWKPLDITAHNGPGVHYNVVSTPDHSCTTASIISAATTRSFITLELDLTCLWVVSTQAGNDIGTKATPASLHVRATTSKNDHAKLYAIRQNNSLHITVDYCPDNVVSNTLYWCQSSRGRCQSDISWQLLPSNISIHTITLEDEQPDEMLVGVSSQTDDNAFLPISWSRCIYNSGADVLVPVLQLPVWRDHTVNLLWEPPSCRPPQNGVIISYILHYCVVETSDDNCSNDVINVDVPRYITHYTLNSVTAGLRYKIWLEGITVEGSTVSATQIIQLPSHHRSYFYMKIGLVVLAIIITIVVTGSWIFFKKIYVYKKTKIPFRAVENNHPVSSMYSLGALPTLPNRTNTVEGSLAASLQHRSSSDSILYMTQDNPMSDLQTGTLITFARSQPCTCGMECEYECSARSIESINLSLSTASCESIEYVKVADNNVIVPCNGEHNLHEDSLDSISSDDNNFTSTDGELNSSDESDFEQQPLFNDLKSFHSSNVDHVATPLDTSSLGSVEYIPLGHVQSAMDMGSGTKDIPFNSDYMCHEDAGIPFNSDYVRHLDAGIAFQSDYACHKDAGIALPNDLAGEDQVSIPAELSDTNCFCPVEHDLLVTQCNRAISDILPKRQFYSSQQLINSSNEIPQPSCLVNNVKDIPDSPLLIGESVSKKDNFNDSGIIDTVDDCDTSS